MSPLESLPPDQRAVVALVVGQRRSYEDIAGMLDIPTGAVRARAHAGLVALGPGNGLPPEVTGPLADYLLGQQSGPDAEATRGLLAESAPARGWASAVAARLAGIAPDPLPPIPAAADATTPATEKAPHPPVGAPTTTEAEGATVVPPQDPGAPGEDRRPGSRVGGILLIAAVLAATVAVLFLVLGRDDADDEPPPSAAATPAATPTTTPEGATAEPRVTDSIELRPAAGGNAAGTMTVFLQGEEQLLFELVARNMPATGARGAYAVWFTGPGERARRLGFTDPVGPDGALGIQGPSERDLARFPRLYATYANVVVSRESTAGGRRPGRVVLIGKLPRGR